MHSTTFISQIQQYRGGEGDNPYCLLLLGQYGLLHCTLEQLNELDSSAVKYKKKNAYGVEALVLREQIPANVEVSSIGMEDLFVFMIKGGK